MKIKTKSGFVCDVNPELAKDWRFCKGLAKLDSGDESLVIQGITFLVPFLLGNDGEAALMEHVKNKDGIISTPEIIAEFKDIFFKIGEESKKSESSQE